MIDAGIYSDILLVVNRSISAVHADHCNHLSEQRIYSLTRLKPVKLLRVTQKLSLVLPN
jgi:hypothetical protein